MFCTYMYLPGVCWATSVGYSKCSIRPCIHKTIYDLRCRNIQICILHNKAKKQKQKTTCDSRKSICEYRVNIFDVPWVFHKHNVHLLKISVLYSTSCAKQGNGKRHILKNKNQTSKEKKIKIKITFRIFEYNFLFFS